MAPVPKSETRDHTESNLSTHPDISAAEAALKARLSRKRTKTGCLTCRKRRIKCGEERPVCKNCIKSKRHCEGYNQRVVFKPPSFDYRPVANGGAHITFQADPAAGPPDTYPQDYVHPHLHPAYYSQPLSKPPEQYVHDYANFNHIQQQLPFGQPIYYVGHASHYPAIPLPPPGYVFQPSLPPHHSTVHSGLPMHMIDGEAQAHHFASTPGFSFQPVHSPPTASQPPMQPDWQIPHPIKLEQTWHFAQPTADMGAQDISPSSKSSRTLSQSYAVGPEDQSPTWPANGYTPRPELRQPIDYQPPRSETQPVQHPSFSPTAPVAQSQNQWSPEFYEYETHAEPMNTPTHFLTQAAVEAQDDDYYDVQSDEEMEVDSFTLAQVDQSRHRALQRILETNNISIQDPQTRRYDTFIHGGVLAHYKPEEAANPLKNPYTVRVFAHFISATGPSLSIYERQFRNSSLLFNEGRVPFSQQSLWTYTMPLAALRHHGLLHAMLALASLHIARLTGASVTPSLQHYAWAIKRIHHCVSDEKKRFRLTTIAATMLLGFYELLTADHMKWNAHLAGSKQLFIDTDFSTMSKQFRRMKSEREARRRQSKRKQSTSSQTKGQDEILDQIYDVDERVISELAGKEVRYDWHGQIMTPKNTIPEPLDLSKFEILKDLYWWYLKQDAYQSIVSGNALLLDYSRWANCPPRAPLGKTDAVYGSFDHLILLLGRIADFAARDRVRKLRVLDGNGGQWRPAPGVKMPGPRPLAPQPPASATTSQPATGGTSAAGQSHGSNPPAAEQPFYGMAPPPRQNVPMPSSYNSTNQVSPSDTSSPQDLIDLPTATQTALEEYGRIRAALLTFSNSLGEGFKPLTSEHQPPLETPFGNALFYRTYDIGNLWAVYHMAMIIAIRSHPHMHPAAHAAAAIAAHETQFFANEIGRIAAGIVPGPPDQPLNPTLGASLCESCMPSFFAGVQYQTAEQRHHTVTRIFSIAERTGWGSAELIANGCETAWVKAAAVGRGPPYTRLGRREKSSDPRLNGSWETLDPNARPDGRDEADRRLVATNPTARLNWAIGIMGTEDDEQSKLNSWSGQTM